MGRDGRSARKNRNASRSSRWIMSLCLNITKRSDSAKLLVRRRVIHRELNQSLSNLATFAKRKLGQEPNANSTRIPLSMVRTIRVSQPGIYIPIYFLSEAPSVPRQVSTTAWQYDTVGCSGSCVHNFG